MKVETKIKIKIVCFSTYKTFDYFHISKFLLPKINNINLKFFYWYYFYILANIFGYKCFYNFYQEKVKYIWWNHWKNKLQFNILANVFGVSHADNLT